MKIDVRIDDREVREALQRLMAAGSNTTPAMRLIAATVEASTQLRFTDGRAPTGAPWKPVRRRGRPGQPLIDTGRLRGSIVSTYSGKEAVIGTNAVYAAIHQFGYSGSVFVKPHSRRGRSGRTHQVRGHEKQMRVTARPYLGLSVADRADIVAIVREHIARAVG